MKAETQTAKSLVTTWIDENKNDILESFKSLVRIPSLTGEEKEAQLFIAEELKKIGLKVEIWEPDMKELFDKYPKIAQYPSKWQPEFDLPLKFSDICTYEQLVSSPYADELNYKDRPNVIGILKGTRGGRSIILNGHADVVTVGDPDKWDKDPFEAYEKNGRIYGRGTCDMKGGLWAMIKAVDAIVSCGIKLKGDICVQSVVNEEHSGNGSLACVSRGFTADAAIVPEPTGAENFSKSSGGGIYWEIRLQGLEAHTGSRWRNGRPNGISAIEKIPGIINGLMKKESEINAKETCLSLGIGTIKGGSYATSTAKECTMTGVAYFSPALGTGISGLDKIKNIFRDVIDDVQKKDPWLKEHPPQVKYLHYDDAYMYPDSSEFLSVLTSAGRSVLSKDLKEISFSACDARHLGNQGNVPTIVYGPGDISLAHSLNEYIETEEIIKAAKVIAAVLCDWCIEDKTEKKPE